MFKNLTNIKPKLISILPQILSSGKLVFALGGAYFSFRLARAKQGLDSDMLKSCNQTSWFDCTAVNNSYFADFFGVPTGSFGFLYYIIIIGIILIQFLRPGVLSRGYAALGFLLSICGVLASLFFAVVSAFSVGQFCEYCFYTYLINIALCGLFFITVKMGKIKLNELMKLLNTK